MRRLNIFNPFERKQEAHEDRLTWAFLVALHYEPQLQRLFRDLVLAKAVGFSLAPHSFVQPATVRTQAGRIEVAA